MQNTCFRSSPQFELRRQPGPGNRPIEQTEMKPFKDETGCLRYTMTFSELQELYMDFENFVADCTQDEYKEYKDAIIRVYTLLHKHINMAFVESE